MQAHQRIQTVLNGYRRVDLMQLKYRLQWVNQIVPLLWVNRLVQG